MLFDHPHWDLNALLACCRRELKRRERFYPKTVAKGWQTQKKADKELEAMRDVCQYFIDAIFRVVTRESDPLVKREDKGIDIVKHASGHLSEAGDESSLRHNGETP